MDLEMTFGVRPNKHLGRKKIGRAPVCQLVFKQLAKKKDCVIKMVDSYYDLKYKGKQYLGPDNIGKAGTYPTLQLTLYPPANSLASVLIRNTMQMISMHVFTTLFQKEKSTFVCNSLLLQT